MPARVAAAEGDDILLVVQIEEFVTPAMEEARRELTLRAVVGGRVVSLGSGIPGSAVALTLRPPPGRWVEGHVEIDPSGLRADDRRFFAVPVRLPTHVALAGVPGPFVEAGLSALESGPRARRVAARSSADVVWAAQGEGLVEALRDGQRAVVVPGEEPLSIPALNARLERAGVPWRYRHEQESGFTLLGAGAEAVPGLRGRRVRKAYRLEPVGSPDARVWVRLETGAPWVVAAQPPGLGTAILLASPLTERSTDLVTDPAMIPFLDALVNGWPGDAEPGPSGEPQGGVVLPARATRVELPSGRRRPVEGGSRFRDLDEAGVYRVLAGDSLMGAFAVNPPASESDLVRATEEDARRRWRTSPILVIGGSESKWRAAIYRARRGRELTAPLLATLLALVLAESGLAAPGAVFRLPRRGKS
ncbi:MAG: hypothetical protein HY702_03525 [Gemmatimonadetes bacterium]|nr:hypothetical protein [Gemmatimonadota bacterium]